MSESAGRLLVLGAGLNQLHGLRAAAAMGLDVVTADNRPDNVGHCISSAQVDVSTVEVDRVVASSRTLGIDGVVTFASDVATPAVAAVAEALGLPGPDGSAVRRLSDKGDFRRLQAEHGFPHPAFVVHDGMDDPVRLPSGFPLPCVAKPTDTSGSRGVRRVDAASQLGPACAEAMSCSRRGRIVIEAFVPGTEIGGDALMSRGSLVFGAVTRKYRSGFVVTGHVVPGDLSAEKEQEVLAVVEATARSAGLDDGPLNFDVMLSDGEAIVLEMSPRTGGNGITRLLERAFDVALYRLVIEQALGATPSISTTPGSSRTCGSVVIGTPHSGTISSLADPVEVRRTLPDLFELDLVASVGDHIGRFDHGGASFGLALFDERPEGEDHMRCVGELRSALHLEVDRDG